MRFMFECPALPSGAKIAGEPQARSGQAISADAPAAKKEVASILAKARAMAMPRKRFCTRSHGLFFVFKVHA